MCKGKEEGIRILHVLILMSCPGYGGVASEYQIMLTLHHGHCCPLVVTPLVERDLLEPVFGPPVQQLQLKVAFVDPVPEEPPVFLDIN